MTVIKKIIRLTGISRLKLFILRRLDGGIKSKWSLKKLEKGVTLLYKNNMGRELNLRNPVLFTEKIQWYKLFYNHPDLGRIVDKYTFKQYLNEKLGDRYTVPIYGMWTNISQIHKEWDHLPDCFVLKSTICDSGRNIIIIKRKHEVEFNEIKKELQQWFDPYNTLINSFCRAYHGTKPRIIAEQYVAQAAQLNDYKFFCFNGNPFCIYAYGYTGRKISGDSGAVTISSTESVTFYDMSWNKLNVKWGYASIGDVDKPEHFDEMIEISKKLSAGFPLVRVDFFEHKEKLFIAEMTFYPGGGLRIITPMEFDEKLGTLFELPLKT